MKPTFITWDWKAQPNMQWIDEAIAKYQHPVIMEVNTHSDFYAIVVYERSKLNQGLAQMMFTNWIRR